MSRWSALGNLWATIREIDAGAIRAEAEQPLHIVAVGHDPALAAIDTLAHQGHNRYPLLSRSLTLLSLRDAARQTDLLRSADMLTLIASSCSYR